MIIVQRQTYAHPMHETVSTLPNGGFLHLLVGERRLGLHSVQTRVVQL